MQFKALLFLASGLAMVSAQYYNDNIHARDASLELDDYLEARDSYLEAREAYLDVRISYLPLL